MLCSLCQENPQTPEVYVQKGQGSPSALFELRRQSTGAHTRRVFSLRVSEGATSLNPKLQALPFPLPFPIAEALGRYSLPEPPTPLNLLFYPKAQKFRLVHPLSVSGAKVSGLCNKPAARSQ